MVEAVGIEPTSEDRVCEASTCVAPDGDLAAWVRTGAANPGGQSHERSGRGVRRTAPFDPLRVTSAAGAVDQGFRRDVASG